MKKVELIFGAILLPLDYLMLILAGITAYFLRFRTIVSLRPVIYTMPFKNFFLIILISSLLLILFFAIAGLYNIRSTRRLTTELRRVFFSCSTGVLLVIILVFFQRELFSSRFIILAAWFFSVVYVSLARILVIFLERSLLTHGLGVHRLILVGSGHTTLEIEQILANKKWGYEIIERIPHFDEQVAEKIEKIIKIEKIDEIMQVDPASSREERLAILDFCNEHHLDFRYAADLFEAQAGRFAIRPIGGIPIIEIRRTPLDGWGKIFKRLVDIFGALILIICFGPLMLLIALLIKLTSPGPIIYRNERVGEHGRFFNTLKFRTMKREFCIGRDFPQTAEALAYEQKLIAERSIKKGPVYKIKDDPRLTPLGRFLRRTSLDELPQFFNVLKGEMSLVGPRPHQPREVEKYAKHQRKVLFIKPGVSGMAQISGRSDLDFEEEVRLDTYYIENWSFWLDLYILFKTPFAVFKKQGAL